MRKARIFLIASLGLGLTAANAQPKAPVFTRADTLRGAPSPGRTCYDLTYYHLDVKVDPAKQSVNGSNEIYFTVITPFTKMQIDLFKNMEIEKITLDDGAAVPFDREFNAVFVNLPNSLEKGSIHRIKVFYGGNPQVAKNPPWGGGLTWAKDSSGNPWVVVTCQGTGASLWWPNKDHQADKPDSMLISITVPQGLTDISNGRLRATKEMPDGWMRYDWFVSYPINNYNVTINVGKFAHCSDTYGSKPALTLDYYVMPQNLERAKKTFEQVKPMMAAFEKYFGKYPFIRDGYKLIESPHTGMEHQSAVAYGNLWLGGYRGFAPSAVGLKFDFIIIHESAHEWWGNGVTSKDIADMWIHESFGAYAEALFVEDQWGYAEALKYINGKKPNVRNTDPIIGKYGVQNEGAGDMYDKGQLVLNTLRSVIDNDILWFSILKGLMDKFHYTTITAEDVIGFVNEKTGKDLSYFFNQYLRNTKIPQLEVSLTFKGDSVMAMYRWNVDVQDFRMPVKVTIAPGKFEFIYPTTTWQRMNIATMEPSDFKADESRFYVNTRLSWRYMDPRVQTGGNRRGSWF
ncbi:MAG: M1 family metallopeptidase [Ignavibacteriales bacterium]|nr:M1 family metallopeptidase [Ignavibacteriales bacterium]